MKKLIVLFAMVLSTMVAAMPATAAPTNQTGLVNVHIDDVTLQVPIAVAANACDLNVAVLVALIADAGETQCKATADADAVSAGDGGGNGPTNQTGLVNVDIGDVTVQVPVAAALNLCDINIAALAVILDAGNTSCEAVANSKAKNN